MTNNTEKSSLYIKNGMQENSNSMIRG